MHIRRRITVIIKTRYTIIEETNALLPAKQIDYNTIVIERSRILYIKQTPLQIIQTSCQKYWSTYEGRRDAVVNQMNFKQKVPIPISIHKAIYLFPTHSPNHLDNSWIAYEHVARFDKKQSPGQPEQTLVTFKNGYTLTLDVSVHTFEKQWQRTFELMYKSGRIGL